jgi:hypothetical protein
MLKQQQHNWNPVFFTLSDVVLNIYIVAFVYLFCLVQ